LGLSISKRLVSLMQGNMWVESNVSKGSKFFTITSQISQSSIESILSKISPFAKRTILFVDTVWDTTGVLDRVKELGLRPFVVHQVTKVADKERCPHIDYHCCGFVDCGAYLVSALFLCPVQLTL
jgi:osomolarity two-component system, sensor histidine kinase NIK1